MGSVGVGNTAFNPYSFHPHCGDPHTNRAPTAKELEIGRSFLTELLQLFSIGKVVAVGNMAETTLKAFGIVAPKIRHPSGGESLFVEGVRRYV